VGAHVAGRVNEFVDRTSRVIEIGGRSIGIVRVGATFYALLNTCPHQGGPVCTGGIYPRTRAEILPNGRIREWYDHAAPVVACPWHGWEFDIETGRCVADPTRRVASYETTVVDGDVIVSLPD
jgi:3-phenylpropionate/trans-cinnamate dioxygenase ferredoxin subunit